MAPIPGQMNLRDRPLALVVSGEAARHDEALRKLLGPAMLVTYRAGGPDELVEIVRRGRADAAVLDTEGEPHELLKTLRIIRRVDAMLPVILVASQVSRRFLEDALRLAAFSVAHKPLEREELLMQLRRIFERFYGL